MWSALTLWGVPKFPRKQMQPPRHPPTHRIQIMYACFLTFRISSEGVPEGCSTSGNGLVVAHTGAAPD